MDSMIKDYSLWPSMSEDFKDSHSIRMDVKVLTTSMWPVENSSISNSKLADAFSWINQFSDFYSKRHSGRKLSFLSRLGTMQLSLVLDNGKFDIQAPTLLGLLLLSFNDNIELSHEDAASLLDISHQEACDILEYLTNDINLLLKTDNIFTLNTSFKAKASKVQLQLPSSLSKRSIEPKPAQSQADKSYLYPFYFNFCFSLLHLRLMLV